MITLEEAEKIRDKKLKELSKSYKDNIIQTGFKEFELGWILYFNSEKFVKNGLTEYMLLGAGVIIIDKNDGSVTSLATHPIQEFIGFTIEELYKKEKYSIPIKNEQERIEAYNKQHEINLKKDEKRQRKLLEEERNNTSFRKIYRMLKSLFE
ncbi:YrhB domain-containing protein [Bernardetia sp.]|uniref:YrhB domain-containing protein n=1 Tax=Bernardetia sp. TaxID=1937974 RepID=UPI0025C410CD|nr:YrhB domain-containing protein [Bernardetia sp.]